MKIEEQVCTLEQSKRLKELGVKQESIFLHVTNFANPRCERIDDGQVIIMAEEEHLYRRKGLGRGFDCGFYPAYTVAELGKMLPSETYTARHGSENSEYANWEWFDDSNEKAMGVYETEAEARAAMLIYLLENNLVTVEEVNRRLAA